MAVRRPAGADPRRADARHRRRRQIRDLHHHQRARRVGQRRDRDLLGNAGAARHLRPALCHERGPADRRDAGQGCERRKRSWPRSCGNTGPCNETRGDQGRRRDPRKHLEEQPARLRPVGLAAGDHGAVRISDRRRAAGAGQHHQSDPAEQLHRDHGARHAADHRRRQYRSVGRLDRRLRRRRRRDHDGRLQDPLAAGGRPLAGARRRDRRGAGLFRRLCEDSLVHRHARRHADLSRPDRQHPARAIRRARSRRISRASVPASSPMS